MNNKGQLGDQLYIIYFIFLLIIITAGVVAGSFTAFGKPYDARKVDSELLIHNLGKCLKSTQDLTEQKLREIMSTCNFEQETFDKGLVLSIVLGKKEVFKNGDSVVCGLQDRYENGPRCSYQNFRLKVDKIIQDVAVTAGSSIK